MKIALYTVDLFSGRERLMPWRTIIELAKFLKYKKNEEVIIVSVCNSRETDSFIIDGVQVITINNNLKDIVSYINRNEFDKFLFQVKWRDGLKNFEILSEIKCDKIAYFDGGVYNIKNSIQLMLTAGYSQSKPYLLESLVPKRLIINKLNSSGFKQIVGFTELTTSKIKKSGFVNTTTILQGNDFEVLSKVGTNNSKYFLFTGAPGLTRGSIQLLRAFDKFANKASDAKIIFLMREDVGSDFSFFYKALESLINKDRIEIIRKNLNPQELKTYFANARAVILPFLVIPSEIPLTFFEVLSMGTPIITFENGGTTQYLSRGLFIAMNISVSSLAKLMQKVWINDDLVNKKSDKAIEIMKNHPLWDQTNENWYKILKSE